MAAGGGGAATFGSAGDAGQEGTSGGGCDDTPAMPGIQNSGGAGGGGCDTIPGNTASGTSGSFGIGGSGGSVPGGGDYGGGGGGGYGGGGGGAFGGGAGGSSYVEPAAFNEAQSLINAAPVVTISYTPGPATRLSLGVAPASVVADGASTSTATVSDANGNPGPGRYRRVLQQRSGEKIGPVTNNGDYTATITSSTTSGLDTITATDTSVSPSVTANATLAQTPGPAAKATVGLVPASILANGTSTATATATVTDANGTRRPAIMSSSQAAMLARRSDR